MVVMEDKKRSVASIGSVATLPNSKHRECSHTPEHRPRSSPAGRSRLLVGEAPKPLKERTVRTWQTENGSLCCASP